MNRAMRRKKGKRQMQRECRRDVVRVLALAEAGRPQKAIAQNVGVSEDFVELILEKAGEVGGDDAA